MSTEKPRVLILPDSRYPMIAHALHDRIVRVMEEKIVMLREEIRMVQFENNKLTEESKSLREVARLLMDNGETKSTFLIHKAETILAALGKKVCSSCGYVKALSEYHFLASAEDKLDPCCVRCYRKKIAKRAVEKTRASEEMAGTQ